MNQFDSTDEQRPLFDWVVWGLIHAVLVGAIGFVGVQVYGWKLGFWVGASAFIAGCTSMYLFAKIVPGETAMKCVLGLAVAANAGYLVHNGAQSAGIELFNAAQIKKFEVGMAQAAAAGTKSMARTLGMNAKAASELEKAFGDGVSVIAAILAFLELSLAIIFFSIASKRVNAIRRKEQSAGGELPKEEKRYLTPPPEVLPVTAKTATHNNSNFYDPTAGK